MRVPPLDETLPSVTSVVRSLRLFTGRKAADLAVVTVDAAPAEEAEVAISADAKTVFLGGLFALAVPAGCYVAEEIVLPIVLAFVLSLVLQPAMRQIEHLHLPRGLAALLIIAVLFGTLAGLGTALSGPATNWAQKLPEGIPKLQERLSFLSRPVATIVKFADQAQGLTHGDQPKAVSVAMQGSGFSDRLAREPLQKASANDGDIICVGERWCARVGGNEAADTGDGGV
jgi:hypothetical protein